MELEKFKDKSMSKRKVLLISLSIILLISVSLLLYKTFSSFTEHVEFPMMNGKVDYFGNSDVYFAFYNGNEKLESMPLKENADGLIFSHGTCDNGASIVWDNEAWAPLVKNLSKSKTKCSLYFGKSIELGKDILPVESGNGLYKVIHNDLTELGQEWNKDEYRYAGANPNNYVSFNNEIWRIIGLVNVKTDSRIEQRIKIVRIDGIREQKSLGTYQWDTETNNWTTSKLKNVLNGIYFESGIGECYTTSSDPNQCDFSSGTDLPKGLDEISRNMIDKEVIWNIGGSATYEITAKEFYEKERGTKVFNNIPTEWSNENDVEKKHNGIGLIYPSDFGYAVGGDERTTCLGYTLYNYNIGNYCGTNNWLKPESGWLWTMTAYSSTSFSAFYVSYGGNLYGDPLNYYHTVFPVVYLKSSIKILSNDNLDTYGSIDNPFQLGIA